MQCLIFLLLFSIASINGTTLKNKLSFNASLLPKLPTLIEESRDNLIDNPLTKPTMFRRFSTYAWSQDIEDNPQYHENWFENLMRSAWDEGLERSTTYEDKVKVCYTMIATYTGALQDLRRYFEVRYLYLGNIEYEVGYMTHEIVNKYQRMIELFGLVRKKYLYQIMKNRAPPHWMLYMYSNILELSKVVIHLCNMLHELKYKYLGQSKSIFNQVLAANKSTDGEIVIENKQWESYVKEYALKKEKERLMKLRNIHINNKKFKAVLTPWTVTPFRGFNITWPLHYGWSIEDW